MNTAFELGGFFAAHAIWSASDGESFSPLLAYSTPDGERHMSRLVHDDFSVAVQVGREGLAANEAGADDAVLVYDGSITLGERKRDAVLIEFRAYFTPDSKAMLAIPYTPKSEQQLFKVHRPELLVWDRCEDFDPNVAINAFFSGVSEHEKGSEVWKRSHSPDD